MPQSAPAWLDEALPEASAGAGMLLAARLGEEKLIGRGGMALRSAAFRDGEELDPCFTAEEEDSVAPPLEWTAPPPGSQELVLVVEDPDAPSKEPFCHWLVWGLAPQKGQLLEGETPPRVGKNSFGNSEWLLPDPPLGDAPHNYVFQLFALDLPLILMPGATREELVAAMEGHVMGVALLTGTFARSEADDFEDWDEDEGD
jgi:hypothetical protein